MHERDDASFDAHPHEPRVAVVGLGEMGHALALNLREREYSVLGCDPSPSARARVRGRIDVASDLREVGSAGAIILSLPGATEVDEVVRRIKRDTHCHLVIDTTTSHPETSRAMAALLREDGRAFVDAPISGGKTLAREGLVSSFVGGHPEDVVEAASLLDAVTGGNWRHMGGPGSGNVTKLMNNALVASHILATAEAFAIGMQFGLDPHDITEAIASASGRSAILEVNLPRWVLNGAYDSGFAYGLMARDARLATEVASVIGVDVPLLHEVVNRWEGLAPGLTSEDDFNRALPAFLEQAGCSRPVEYPN